MAITYCIGDIHGCLAQVQNLAERCQEDADGEDARFIFLGDYIDRDPNPRGVVDYLMDFQSHDPDRTICLMGNHEDMLLSAYDSHADEQQWLDNGGGATLASYRVSSAVDLPSAHVDWLRARPLFHDDGHRFFVHAGVDPAKPLDRQKRSDLLWIREPFLSQTKPLDRLIVHGHTPLRNGVPDLRTNRLNLDTGAVFGGPLAAAVFEPGSIEPVDYILDR